MRAEYTFDVIAHGECVIRTPRIDEPPSAADEDLIHVVAFFFTSAIRFREKDAIVAALHFQHEITGTASRLHGDQRDTLVLDELERQMERAIRSRRLVVEQVKPVEAPRQRISPEPAEVVGPSPAPTPPRPSPAEEAPLWYEVTVIDDQGEAVEDLELVFSAGGRSHKATTDSSGLARWDNAQGSMGSVRLASLKQVRDVMFPKWEARTELSEYEPPENATTVLVRAPLTSTALHAATPHVIVLKQHILRVRLIGMFFDHAKCFLLPSAMNGIRKVREIYDQLPHARLLIVGHTNTLAASGPEYNDRLSLERAGSVSAFLRDQVEDWLAWYKNAAVSPSLKWDYPEDRKMLSVLPDGSSTPYWTDSDTRTYDAYVRFQNDKGMHPDGIGDDELRRAIITDYMALDRTSLPSSVEVVVHGCGQHWIDVEPGEDERNRRVEIFVFDGPITPAPQGELSGSGATDYPAWCANSIEDFDFSSDTSHSLRIFAHDIAGRALESVLISLVGEMSVAKHTDTEGRVQVQDLKPGHYAVTASREGYTLCSGTITYPVTEPVQLGAEGRKAKASLTESPKHVVEAENRPDISIRLDLTYQYDVCASCRSERSTIDDAHTLAMHQVLFAMIMIDRLNTDTNAQKRLVDYFGKEALSYKNTIRDRFVLLACGLQEHYTYRCAQIGGKLFLGECGKGVQAETSRKSPHDIFLCMPNWTKCERDIRAAVVVHESVHRCNIWEESSPSAHAWLSRKGCAFVGDVSGRNTEPLLWNADSYAGFGRWAQLNI